MPNQDMLIPIIPRAPAKPGSGEIKKEIGKISKKQKIKEGDASEATQKQRSQQKQPESKNEDKEGGIDTYV